MKVSWLTDEACLSRNLVPHKTNSLPYYQQSLWNSQDQVTNTHQGKKQAKLKLTRPDPSPASLKLVFQSSLDTNKVQTKSRKFWIKLPVKTGSPKPRNLPKPTNSNTNPTLKTFNLTKNHFFHQTYEVQRANTHNKTSPWSNPSSSVVKTKTSNSSLRY